MLAVVSAVNGVPHLAQRFAVVVVVVISVCHGSVGF